MTRPGVEVVFHQARMLAGVERATFLASACDGDDDLRASVESLLEAADDAGSFMDFGASHDIAEAEVEDGMIGPFKLLERIGEGGFGSVWMADQREPVKRRVALKIIKLGMDTKQVIARFEAERQALAMMDHPNIAKVFEAGATERGRPYFVMELVRGIPIMDYCDSNRLDTRDRLELFLGVCHAIQHAHQKGIIHRDIKPTNVLVTLHDGVPVPKVIDFGVAKATNTELTQKTLFTRHRQVIGTPAYMSPEQAEMSGLDVDTRSDIYALGVLLYELLTGTTPFDVPELMKEGFAEVMRVIREDEPDKPSTRLNLLGDTAMRTADLRQVDPKRLGLILHGDLDWIVMRCLEKDRRRRYDTASGLAADITRHLRDEPVLAGPPSSAYRLQKFVKRHRLRVIAGTLVGTAIVLAAVGTTFGMLWAMSEQRRAEAAERAAETRASELERIAAFQAAQLADLNPQVVGEEIRVRLEDQIITSLRGDPDVTSADAEVTADQLRDLLARANFTDLSLDALDAHIFERALKTIESDFSDQPVVKARLLQSIADTLVDVGLIERSVAPQAEALAIRRTELGNEHLDTIFSINNMGHVLLDQGKVEEAEPYYVEALEIRQRLFGQNHPHTILSINNMAYLRGMQGRREEAAQLMRQAVAARRELYGDDDAKTLQAMSSLAAALFQLGEFDEAELHARTAAQGMKRVLGHDHRKTLVGLANHGAILAKMERWDEAEVRMREVLEARSRLLGSDHTRTLMARSNLAGLLRSTDRLEQAEAMDAETVERARATLPEGHWDLGIFLGQHLKTLTAMQRFEEGESVGMEAFAILADRLGNDHFRTQKVIGDLVDLYTKWHREEPGRMYDEKAEVWRSRLSE